MSRCTAGVVEHVRAADVDVVINLTAGMGGDLVLGGPDSPLPLDGAGTDMAGATERLAHVAELRPEICTLDCGTMNFAAGGDYVMANTPDMLRAMARQIQALGVRPELEVFDYGQLVMVKDLIDEGLIDDPVLVQLCMGIRYGAPDDPGTLLGLVIAAGRRRCSPPSRSGGCSCPTWRMAVLAGGNVRVGLEDNLYLGPGQKATNARAGGAGGHDPQGDERPRARRPTRSASGWRCARPRGASASRPAPPVGLLGAGVIGGGWAARFLLAGVDVRLFDPVPGAGERSTSRVRARAGAPGGG